MKSYKEWKEENHNESFFKNIGNMLGRVPTIEPEEDQNQTGIRGGYCPFCKQRYLVIKTDDADTINSWYCQKCGKEWRRDGIYKGKYIDS